MKKLLALIFILSVTQLSFGQDDSYVAGDSSPKSQPNSAKSGGFDWSKVTVGGGLFLQFGSNSYIAVSPTVGYRLTEQLIVGVGGSYIYESTNDPNYIDYKATTLSGSIYTQYVFEQLPIILHGEIEQASIDLSYENEVYASQKISMTNVYVGGGLKQSMGGNSYLYVMALYNLNETKESNYIQTNPIIRIGVAIGL